MWRRGGVQIDTPNMFQQFIWSMKMSSGWNCVMTAAMKRVWRRVQSVELQQGGLNWVWRSRAWTECYMRWRMSHSSSREVTVRDSESWTDRVTYWSVHSCVVRVINERLVENKTLVLLWAETKQSQETHNRWPPNWRMGQFFGPHGPVFCWTDCLKIKQMFIWSKDI